MIVGKISDWGEYVTVQSSLLDVETANLIGAAKGEITATTRVKEKFGNTLGSSNISNLSQTASQVKGSFKPIEKTIGDLKLIIEDIRQSSEVLEVKLRIYNNLSQSSEIAVYIGNYMTTPTKINNYGDIYYSSFAQIGTNQATYGGWPVGQVVAGKAWVKATLSFENVPDIDSINILQFWISYQNNGLQSKLIDLRSVPINKA
jgi:hypothetical protein